MSKEIIKEKNYSFYMFKCNDPDIINTYVGSTQNFRIRKSSHKGDCYNENNNRYNFQVYKIIRENGGWSNWKMVQIHEQICKSRIHSNQIEQEFIEKHQADMNMKRAFRTDEERIEQKREGHKKYRAENAEELREYNQKYYTENADKIKEHVKIYNAENTDKKREYNKIYHAENAEKLREQRQKYYAENIDKIRERDRKRYAEKKLNKIN